MSRDTGTLQRMAIARQNPIDTPAGEFSVHRLLDTDVVRVRQVDCRGTCRHRSAEECASHTHFVFPFRGVYLRHVGNDQAVADANHVLFFNRDQGYQVSHPVSGGDTSLVLSVSEPLLAEIVPKSLVAGGAGPSVPVRVQKALAVTMQVDSHNAMKTAVKPDAGLTAPIAAGQRVGTVTVTAPEFPALTVPVYAAEALAPASIFQRMMGMFGQKK